MAQLATVRISNKELDALDVLLGQATPGPWAEDDCNIFSKRMSDDRHAAIMAKINKHPYDKNAVHLDAFVASTKQRHEQSDADAQLIVALRNAAAALIAEVRASRARKASRL